MGGNSKNLARISGLGGNAKRLFPIYEILKTTVKDLADKNGIKDRDRIKEGQVLRY
ncbi:MAG: LysM peptidoglycan-binding domain-containing protein [Lachnospiraceae bacterium]|nr:LysM peptidoglycan-binding domain-containing protein [Lachnospiraceae bacterium]